MAATLEQLLANRNTWSQGINLGVFHDQKDIFRDNVPIEKGRRVHFPLKGNDCDDIENGHKFASLGEDWDVGPSRLHTEDEVHQNHYGRKTDGRQILVYVQLRIRLSLSRHMQAYQHAAVAC